MIAGGSFDDGASDLSAQVRQDHQLRRLSGTVVSDVLSPVVYERPCSGVPRSDAGL